VFASGHGSTEYEQMVYEARTLLLQNAAAGQKGAAL
jgi:hypothetical protein